MGEDSRLRTLLFKVLRFVKLPVLLLVVFDGRQRPKEKRGSKMGKSDSHAMTTGMKEILDICGMEWQMVLSIDCLQKKSLKR